MSIARLSKTTIALLFFESAHLMCISHSVFIQRQITTDPLYELALSNYQQRHTLHNNATPYALSFKPFYQQSTKARSLGRYFLPSGSNPIALEENGSGDINPLWLEGIAPFGKAYSSQLSLKPSIQQYGAVFNFYCFLDSICDKLWLSINTTIMSVSTNLHLKECYLRNQGMIECLETAQQMLTDCAWHYGKIPNCTKSKTGMDDIQVKLGYDLIERDRGHIGLYLIGTIPTGSKPKNVTLFEPLVGSRNGSFGCGINTDYYMSRTGEHGLTWMLDVKYRYVFSANNVRSFDLKNNGDWSRYLLLATENNPAAPLPGINFLTIPVRITPRSTIDLWGGVHCEHKAWQFEAGYSFWWRQSERVKLCKPLVTTLGIFDLQGAAIGDPISASTATIAETVAAPGYSNIMTSDASFTTLSGKDLNICTGAHPETYSNALAVSIGYQTCNWLLGVNASYELGKSSSALSNWAAWLTASLQF